MNKSKSSNVLYQSVLQSQEAGEKAINPKKNRPETSESFFVFPLLTENLTEAEGTMKERETAEGNPSSR